MLQKITYGESLEISQDNVYDGVCFSKVTNLQCTDYNSTIKRIHRKFFFNYIPKTTVLHRIF